MLKSRLSGRAGPEAKLAGVAREVTAEQTAERGAGDDGTRAVVVKAEPRGADTFFVAEQRRGLRDRLTR